MNKVYLYLFMSIGGFVGGYIPVLFGFDAFSPWSILTSAAGAIVGIFVARKLSV